MKYLPPYRLIYNSTAVELFIFRFGLFPVLQVLPQTRYGLACYCCWCIHSAFMPPPLALSHRCRDTMQQEQRLALQLKCSLMSIAMHMKYLCCIAVFNCVCCVSQLHMQCTIIFIAWSIADLHFCQQSSYKCTFLPQKQLYPKNLRTGRLVYLIGHSSGWHVGTGTNIIVNVLAKDVGLRR